MPAFVPKTVKHLDPKPKKTRRVTGDVGQFDAKAGGSLFIDMIRTGRTGSDKPDTHRGEFFHNRRGNLVAGENDDSLLARGISQRIRAQRVGDKGNIMFFFDWPWPKILFRKV